MGHAFSMHLTMLLDMAVDGMGDRVAFGSKNGGLTYQALRAQAPRACQWAKAKGVERVGMVDINSEAVPILLYGAAFAELPYVPVNYRLADEQLAAILQRTAPSVMVVEEGVKDRVGSIDGVELVNRSDFFKQLAEVEPTDDYVDGDPDDIAILLFTSGTTGEPKAAVL